MFTSPERAEAARQALHRLVQQEMAKSDATTVTTSTSTSTSSNSSSSTSSKPENFMSKMKRIRYIFGPLRLCTKLLCRMAAQEDLLADSVFEDDTAAGIVDAYIKPPIEDVECLRCGIKLAGSLK
jgi:hypothetical protein